MTSDPAYSDGITANWDVHIPPELVALYPQLSPILSNPEWEDVFDRYDSAAKANKTRYTIVGVASVVLSLVALCFAVFELALGRHGMAVERWVEILFAGAGVVAIGLVAYSRVADLRTKWLRSLYVRESFRRWKYRLLLNGAVMDLVETSVPQFEHEIARLWAAFKLDVRVADGALQQWLLSGDSVASMATNSFRPPLSASIRSDILELLEILRINYQIRYSTAKTIVGSRKVSVQEVTYFTDWLATATLLLALVTTVLVFVVDVGGGAFGVSLDAVAALGVGSAVVSAGVRALRSGLTIPDERDSYLVYTAELIGFRDQLADAADDDGRWRIHLQVEAAAERELGRFLLAKSGSRFIL
jgi:hypothetical protein